MYWGNWKSFGRAVPRLTLTHMHIWFLCLCSSWVRGLQSLWTFARVSLRVQLHSQPATGLWERGLQTSPRAQVREMCLWNTSLCSWFFDLTECQRRPQNKDSQLNTHTHRSVFEETRHFIVCGSLRYSLFFSQWTHSSSVRV